MQPSGRAAVGLPCQTSGGRGRPLPTESDRFPQRWTPCRRSPRKPGSTTTISAARGIHHKYGSAYSAFEFAARPQRPVLLNEHYRCHPHIARWFNRTFYKGELTVLTDVSDTSRRDRAICWVDVDGAATRPAAGSWFNRAEAEQTVRQLRAVIESGYETVGVVTPFTAQAKLHRADR